MIIAGLLCENAEVFSSNGSNYATIGGKCISYPQFPLLLKQKVDNTITAAEHVELDKMGLTIIDDRRNKWMLCNLSVMDFIPDYDPTRQTVNREIVPCKLRGGACKSEGKLCLPTEAKSSGLTNREVEVLKLIGEKLLNKEIADQLGISVNTVPVHTKKIRVKTGLHRKADLALYAKQLNLV